MQRILQVSPLMPASSGDRFVVVDVGNTRIKWGLCAGGDLRESASLAPEESDWRVQLGRWQAANLRGWLVSGVHPQRRDRLAQWLTQQGVRVVMLTSFRQIPLEINLDEPDRVGIDRLLNAVAVNSRRRPGHAAVIIDAGSAVTVDYLDRQGRFAGGAIFPGLRLMAQALHDHTALLPLVEVQMVPPPLGRSTISAIEAGVFYAVAGGIDRLIETLAPDRNDVDLFIGGGDGGLLAPALSRHAHVWDEMTLTGLLKTAERLL
jgi:type III pantothenate kinase